MYDIIDDSDFNDVFDVKEIRQKEIVILRQTPYYIVEDDNL